MARELSLVARVQPVAVKGDEAELKQAAEKLRNAGYGIRADADLRTMAEQRADYRSCVDALADHLGKPSPVLVRQD